MTLNHTPRDPSYEMVTEKDHAQILVDLAQSSKSVEEAKKIIDNLGIQTIETKYLSSNQILFKLDIRDMRNIALVMTEHGFVVQGINALPTR